MPVAGVEFILLIRPQLLLQAATRLSSPLLQMGRIDNDEIPTPTLAFPTGLPLPARGWLFDEQDSVFVTEEIFFRLGHGVLDQM